MIRGKKRHQNLPETFPLPWASDWGRDRYGLWLAFTYKNVRQCFRWVKPGTFKMGSPVNEPERNNDESLHDVTISRGLWLADTACTQELWQAVMGSNPSDFKGALRPVENVNWRDCRKFIDKINALQPGLELRLPTEAEWEYACRAGTQTPFWFGDNITLKQVNYNGNYPYAGGKKGRYRRETVEVKALPCNGWGLYQMHGNVWEWCADRYGAYPTGHVVDPVGPETGVFRVLRGGGWDLNGGDVRSASRNYGVPSLGWFSTGFRLARG